MSREKKIRLVAIDRRYRLEPYPAMPILNHKLGTYITGQHIDPANPATKNNLTISEIKGDKLLSDEKLKKFPYVIRAEERIPLVNFRWYDLTQDEAGFYINPKDKAEYDFTILQEVVSPSKEKVILGKHYFYLEDKQREAEVRVIDRKLRNTAESKVLAETNITRYKDIAMLLNYKVQGLNIIYENMTDALLQDALLDACEKHPKEVISCYENHVADDIFVLKAANYGIIQRKGVSFFDGQQFLGDSVEDVKRFIKSEDGKKYQIRWSRHIAQREGLEHSGANEVKTAENERMDSILNELAYAIVYEDKEKIPVLIEQAELIDKDNEKLIQLKAKVKTEDPEKQRLQQLRMQAGKLQIAKEVYQSLNVVELERLIQETKDKK